MHAHVHHMPGFKAVSGVVQRTCSCLSNARLQGSGWRGTTYPPHARLQGSESECSEVVQHACDMPDFKALKVSEVEWYNMYAHARLQGIESE